MLEDCNYIQLIVGEPTLRMSNGAFSSERKVLLINDVVELLCLKVGQSTFP